MVNTRLVKWMFLDVYLKMFLIQSSPASYSTVPDVFLNNNNNNNDNNNDNNDDDDDNGGGSSNSSSSSYDDDDDDDTNATHDLK